MNSRIFNTWRDPYDEGFSICKKSQIEIHSGLTVLVGCNGAGKSTTLHNIKEELQNENIPYYHFDNLHDGGSNAKSEATFDENWEFVATSMCSSEGENINLNIGSMAANLKSFMITGCVDNFNSRLADALDKAFGNSNEEYDNCPGTNERWLLLDAIDSGFSIDNVVELKNFFKLVIDDFKKNGYELYIVVSANEYELAYFEDCFDVMSGKYIRFIDYEDFKKFILETRKEKDKRYQDD